MANGENLDLNEIWEDVDVTHNVPLKATKDSFFVISKAFERLSCKTHARSLRKLNLFMGICYAIGSILMGCGVVGLLFGKLFAE